MTDQIQVLYVDDDPDLLKLGEIFLKHSGNFYVTTARGAHEAIPLLRDLTFDVIISDYHMPQMDGIAFLKHLKHGGNATPFILFTGKGREEVVIEALNEGADFYIQKGGEPKSQFAELSNKVRYAVLRRRAEQALEQSEQRYRLMNDASLDFLYSYDLAGRFTSANRSFCKALGLDLDQIIGKTHADLKFPTTLCQDLDNIHKQVYNTGTTATGFVSTQMPDGTVHEYENVSNPLYDQSGILIGIAGTARDITEHRRADIRLSELNSAFLSFTPDPLENINILTGLAGKMLHGTCALYNRLEEGMLCSLGMWNTPPDFSRIDTPYGHICYDIIQNNRGSPTIIPNLMTSSYAETDPNVRQYNLQTYIGIPVKIGEKFLGSLCVVYQEIYSPSPQDLEILSFISRAIATEDERRVAGMSILESEQRFRSIIHAMQFGIIIIDAQTHTIIEANNKALEMIGASNETVTGSICHRFVCPAEIGRCPVSNLGQTIDSSERILLTIQGESIPIIKSVIKTSLGGQEVLIESFIDITDRVRVELALKESEEKYRTLFDSASDAIFIHDEKGRILSANRTACEQLGYTYPEILSMTVNQVDSPKEALLALNRIAHLMKYGHISFETEHLCKDGSLIPMEVRAQQIIWDGQHVVMSICRNISERKNSELMFQTLVRSIVGSTGIESLHKITKNISLWLGAECVMVGEIQSDKNTVKILSMLLDGEYVSDFSYSLTGTPCENVADKGYCLYPDNAINLFPDSKDLIDLNIRGYVGTPLRNLEGTVIGILCALFRNPITHSPAMQEIINIIAVKAAAEIEAMRMIDALQESEERFRMLLEHVPSVAVQGYNMDGTTQYWNDASMNLYGYTAEEALGKNLVDLIIPPEMKDDVRSAMAFMAETGQPIPASELSLMKKDGSRVSVFSSHAIVTRSGGDTELFCIDIDLSERKRDEEALREAIQKLRLLTSLTRHDIFNQLTAGQLFLDMARETPEFEKKAEYISHAYEANRRIESIIGFTREYESFGTASSRWLGLRPTIESAKIEISPEIAKIENQIPEKIEVYADPILRKVFSTLMENAARHGGDISCIRFSCQMVEDSLIIICTDDGVGIQMDEKIQIFDHGYGKNTGIGLFLAKEILSITGLSIRECGIPGEGARFEILVPAGKFRQSQAIEQPKEILR
jgi:PAS domain S-box-containing protein